MVAELYTTEFTRTHGPSVFKIIEENQDTFRLSFPSDDKLIQKVPRSRAWIFVRLLYLSHPDGDSLVFNLERLSFERHQSARVYQLIVASLSTCGSPHMDVSNPISDVGPNHPPHCRSFHYSDSFCCKTGAYQWKKVMTRSHEPYIG